MLTSRIWIISSGLVGAISMLRSALNFSATGSLFSLSTFSPLFIISIVIFALAASTYLFGHGSDPPVTEHHHDENTYHYDYDYHYNHDQNHNHGHDHDHEHDRSSNNSSFDQYNNKVHEEENLAVRSESGLASSSDFRFASTAPEKAVGLRRPPSAPLKTFPQDDKSGDENETMDEMWKRVKAEKQPAKPNTWQDHVVSRNKSRLSTSSCPSPPPAPSKRKMLERIPTWVELKKEFSVGRDELNSRVEAFIRKFNDEMKLQRLESLKRYNIFSPRSDEK